MGDSAKVVSPFGARGGNTGISDADNLAWKLAAVVKGQVKGKAQKVLLQSYHAERHEAAATNVQVTQRTARFLRAKDGIERTFRDATLHLAKKHAFARSLVNTGRMAVANPYAHSPLTSPELAISHSVQNVEFEWGDGSRGQLNDLLKWAQGRALLLVWLGEKNAKAQLAELQASDLARRARIVCVARQAQQVRAIESVVDASSALAKACHMASPAWSVIRPDSYLAASSSQWSVAAIGQALVPLASA